MSDDSYADFRLTAFGEPYMVWHDGPSFYDLREHWEQDPARVEGMLMVGLTQGDDLAAESMGELQDIAGDAAPRFEAALRARLPSSIGTMRVRVAESLRRYTGSDEWDTHVGDSLSDPNFWSERINAAMALKRAKPTEALITVLEAGVQDDEYLVRYHSANTLVAWSGASDAIEDRDEQFGDLVADEAPERWAKVAGELGFAARTALRG